MHESERLSTLVGTIYDAALDPSLWIKALDGTKDFVSGEGAGLAWKDAVANRGECEYYTGIEPHYHRLYFDTYIKLDPCTTGQFFAEIGEPVATEDMIAYDEFVQTRVYKEWARPQGLVDCAVTVLEKSATSIAFLALFRHERHGLIDQEARRRMRLLSPHFRRAVLIGKALDLKTGEAASLADTLDGISAGMFLIDGNGRIVHANAVGHTMLRTGIVLRAETGRLSASDQHASQMLADTFAHAGHGDAAVGIKGIAVPLVARDGERHVAHVLPLTSGARRQAGTSYAAVAALFVHKAALDAPSPPEAIAKAFKLTPMELRVLLAIVEVGGIPEAAEALGIAQTTIKTHLTRLYAKTGANRHADLVKLVAAFSSPLLK